MHWKTMVSLAEDEVEATLAELPDALRAPARALPVTFERRPNAELQADGLEPDTLGLFVGPAYADEGNTLSPVPAQIILFLENIWDMAKGDKDYFLYEIHTTYVHELGHYLGLDEDDLIDRGLE